MESAVLFISPDSAQAENVTEMLRPATLGLDHAACLADARIMLAKHPYRVILTEAELPDAVWTDVIDLTYDLGVFPAIIVTRLTADDVFWAEVLNLGAYDLLAQPFDERKERTHATILVVPDTRHRSPGLVVGGCRLGGRTVASSR
jgi:DNA-binding NtrC family response regulator